MKLHKNHKTFLAAFPTFRRGYSDAGDSAVFVGDRLEATGSVGSVETTAECGGEFVGSGNLTGDERDFVSGAQRFVVGDALRGRQHFALHLGIDKGAFGGAHQRHAVKGHVAVEVFVSHHSHGQFCAVGLLHLELAGMGGNSPRAERHGGREEKRKKCFLHNVIIICNDINKFVCLRTSWPFHKELITFEALQI